MKCIWLWWRCTLMYVDVNKWWWWCRWRTTKPTNSFSGSCCCCHAVKQQCMKSHQNIGRWPQSWLPHNKNKKKCWCVRASSIKIWCNKLFKQAKSRQQQPAVRQANQAVFFLSLCCLIAQQHVTQLQRLATTTGKSCIIDMGKTIQLINNERVWHRTWGQL